MIDIIKDYVALVVIIIAEEVDLKVHQEDQKDRFLQRLHFEAGRLEEEVTIVVIATNFVCAVQRSWEYWCRQRYHRLRM